MKGVLKIKVLKKYIAIVFTAFAFLFININGVNASNDYIVSTNFDYSLIKDTSRNSLMNENNYYEYVFLSDDYDFYRFYDQNLDTYVNARQIAFSPKEHKNTLETYKYMYIKADTDNLRIYYRNDATTGENFYIEADFSNGVLIDLTLLPSTNFGTQYVAFIAGDYLYELDFFEKIEEKYEYNINNLNYDINNNEVVFSYELPNDDNFSHLELHQDGLLLADNITTDYFEVYNLEYDTKYNFTFYAVDKYGLKSTAISREIALPSDPNLIPSNNIFGLNHSVSDTTVSFNYSLPLDNNFSHLKIYRNNELINDNYQLAEFIDIGLEPETEYNYRFVSVNKMDIANVGYAVTIKTMEENDTVPPAVPTGLNTTNMNSGIVLSWNTNTESDLQGYYVYMNGVKMNTKPISNSIYNITNLENGSEYNFTVSAVDTFGNESEQSAIVLGVPDVDNLPIFKLDTQLSSIGSSVENWFSEIWLIVAFATAIPLSFAIAGRVKGLFIA